MARPVDGAAEVLHRLTADGARVAVVTGRDVPTLLELSGLGDLPGLIVSGLHGAQRWESGQLSSITEPAALDAVRSRLPGLVEAVENTGWVEDKGLSLVVHTRRSPDPAAAQARLEPPVRDLAGEYGLDVVAGRAVLEVRIPGLSKRNAITDLLRREATAVLVAGDDTGDLPAFAAVHEWRASTGRPAVAVSVGDVPEVAEAADMSVAHPADLVDLLGAMLSGDIGQRRR
jgi:trehalose 6-phosphate phosphatase